MNYLENILLELKHVGIVQSQRGTSGGFRLARRPADISLADVIRAVDGPMANVRGSRPGGGRVPGHRRSTCATFGSPCAAALRELLETTSVQDLIDGHLPKRMDELTKRRAPGSAWDAFGMR